MNMMQGKCVGGLFTVYTVAICLLSFPETIVHHGRGCAKRPAGVATVSFKQLPRHRRRLATSDNPFALDFGEYNP